MSKHYLSYLFKTRKSLNVFILIINIFLFIIGFTTLQRKDILEFSFNGAFILALVLAFSLVPIYFSYVHNKKAVDSYFAINVSRRSVLISTIFFICLSIIIPFILYIVSSSILLSALNVSIQLSKLILFILLSIIVICSMVIFNTNAFLEANSIFDGIVIILGYFLLPFFIFFTVNAFQENLVYGFNPIQFSNVIKISLPINASIYETSLIEAISKIETIEDSYRILSVLIDTIVYTFLGIVGLRKNYVNRKVERAETISKGFFSYPFIIYSFTVLFIFCVTFSCSTVDALISDLFDHVFLYMLVFIFFMVSTFIYRRKIKTRLYDILFFLIAIALSLGITYAANNTHGFYLADSYDKNPYNIIISYNINRNNEKMNDFVNEIYGEDADYYYQATLKIPHNKMEECKDVLNRIDILRRQAINDYYDMVETVDGYLSLTTNFNENNEYYPLYENYTYQYKAEDSLSIDELLRYEELGAEIYIDVYYQDSIDHFESLSDFLKIKE